MNVEWMVKVMNDTEPASYAGARSATAVKQGFARVLYRSKNKGVGQIDDGIQNLESR